MDRWLVLVKQAETEAKHSPSPPLRPTLTLCPTPAMYLTLSISCFLKKIVLNFFDLLSDLPALRGTLMSC